MHDERIAMIEGSLGRVIAGKHAGSVLELTLLEQGDAPPHRIGEAFGGRGVLLTYEETIRPSVRRQQGAITMCQTIDNSSNAIRPRAAQDMAGSFGWGKAGGN